MSVIKLDVGDTPILDESLPTNADVCPWPDVHVGHCVVRWRQCLLVFGGFRKIYDTRNLVEPDEGPYHTTRRLWKFNAETREWRVVETYGESPPPVSAAGCAIVSDCLFVFCGYSRHNFYNESVYRLDLLTNIWTHVFPQPAINTSLQPSPSGRDKLAALEHNGDAYLFGGYGILPVHYGLFDEIFVDPDREQMMDLKVWHNSFIKFDCASYKFELIRTRGDQPTPRAACSSCKIGICFYIFGGRLASCRMDDMYVLDLDTFTWKRIEPANSSSDWPEGRSWGVMSPIANNSKILLQGGLNSQGNTLNDFWLFDVLTLTWKRLDSFEARLFWHSGCNIEDKVYLFGGFRHESVRTSEEESSSAMLIVSLSPPSLQSLAINSISDAIVSSYGHFSQDSMWGVLGQFLPPQHLAAIQKTVQQMKFLNCHSLHTSC